MLNVTTLHSQSDVGTSLSLSVCAYFESMATHRKQECITYFPFSASYENLAALKGSVLHC